MRRWLVGAALLLVAGTAGAGRPPEAIEADRDAAEAEAHDLERRAQAVDAQLAARRARLKKRLRAIYQLSSGGVLRLLLESESAADLQARRAGIDRLLARDLDELAQVRDEAKALEAARAEQAAALARVDDLGRELACTAADAPTGLAASKGRLVRPVPGVTVGRFGSYEVALPGPRAHEPIQLERRGLELSAGAGEPVRAVASGRVAWIGEVPGHGHGVAIDHGDGYLTITAHLDPVTVEPGDEVAAGATLGVAAPPSIYFELAQGGTPLDPAGWLAPR